MSNSQSTDNVKKFVSGVRSLGLTAAVTMLLSFFMRVVLARTLGAEQVGLLQTLESYAHMFFSVLTLGLSTYIFREVPSHPEVAKKILAPSVVFCGFFGMLIYCFYSLYIGSFTEISGVNFLVAGLSAFALLKSYQLNIPRRILLSIDQTVAIAKAETIGRSAGIVLAIVFAYYYRSLALVVMALVIGEFISCSMMVVGLINLGYWQSPLVFSEIKKAIAVTVPFFGVSLLVNVYNYIDVALLAGATSSTEVGIYSCILRLKGLAFAGVPVLQGMLTPIISKASKEDRKQLQRVVRVQWRLLLAVGCFFGFLFCLFAKDMINLLFGVEFVSAAPALAATAVICILTYTNILVGAILNQLSTGRLFFVATLISVGLLVALSNLLMQQNSLGYPGGGALAMVTAIAISEAIVLVILLSLVPQGVFGKQDYLRLIVLLVGSIFLATSHDQFEGFSILLRVLIFLIVLPVCLFGTGVVRVGDFHELKRLMGK